MAESCWTVANPTGSYRVVSVALKLAAMVLSLWLVFNGTLLWAPLYDALHAGTPSNVDNTYTMFERCHMDANAVLHPYYTHQPGCSAQ